MISPSSMATLWLFTLNIVPSSRRHQVITGCVETLPKPEKIHWKSFPEKKGFSWESHWPNAILQRRDTTAQGIDSSRTHVDMAVGPTWGPRWQEVQAQRLIHLLEYVVFLHFPGFFFFAFIISHPIPKFVVLWRFSNPYEPILDANQCKRRYIPDCTESSTCQGVELLPWFHDAFVIYPQFPPFLDMENKMAELTGEEKRAWCFIESRLKRRRIIWTARCKSTNDAISHLKKNLLRPSQWFCFGSSIVGSCHLPYSVFQWDFKASRPWGRSGSGATVLRAT